MTEKLESKVSQLFKNLEYGPAPESPKIAYEWLNSHERKFGHFINGKWVLPEGREQVECKSPATGIMYLNNDNIYCFLNISYRIIFECLNLMF